MAVHGGDQFVASCLLSIKSVCQILAERGVHTSVSFMMPPGKDSDLGIVGKGGVGDNGFGGEGLDAGGKMDRITYLCWDDTCAFCTT